MTPALLFKLGVPPFHGWVISLRERIRIKEFSLVLTVQKFIPINISLAIINFKLVILRVIFFIIIIILYSNRLSRIKIIITIRSIGGTY
jgi:hypothetical protein